MDRHDAAIPRRSTSTPRHPRHGWATLGICAVLAALAGCRPTVQSYEGPPRPPDDIAGIRTNTIDAQADLAIEAVDGRRVNVTHAELMLLPGQHTLHVRVSTAPAIDFNRLAADEPGAGPPRTAEHRKSYWFDLQLTVEPGRRYVLNGAATDRHASAWIIDELTGARITEASTQ